MKLLFPYHGIRVPTEAYPAQHLMLLDFLIFGQPDRYKMKSHGFNLYLSEAFYFQEKKRTFFLLDTVENTNYYVSMFWLYNLGECHWGIFLFFFFFS